MKQSNGTPTPPAEDRPVPTKRPRKAPQAGPKAEPVEEIGGTEGPEPTRYGDWENKGIVSDF
jgi:hypothetical protein